MFAAPARLIAGTRCPLRALSSSCSRRDPARLARRRHFRARFAGFHRRYRVASRASCEGAAADLALRVVEAADHFVDLQLLVVEVEHRRVELDQRPALDLPATNSTVFVEREPAVRESVVHPYVVVHVLGIVRKVIDHAVDKPPELPQVCCDPGTQAAVEEELRRPA